MKNARGFTLIELLVAVSILAIIAVLGWQGLDSIVRARVSLNEELAQARGLQLTFAQMQSDCAHIAPTTAVRGRPLVAAQDNSLTLIRTVHIENQPTRLQVIAYRLRDGVLTRRESIATRDLKELDDAWSAAIGDRDIAPAVVLQNNVNQMTIRSWVDDGKGWRAGVDNTAAQASAATAANPPAGNQPAGNQPAQNAQRSPVKQVSGLEVALQLSNRTSSMVKVFLLGAA